MTMVKINGEELEVTVDAPGAGLAEAAEAALRLHRRVCAGTRQAQRAEERRQDHGGTGAITRPQPPREFGFVWLGEGEQPEADA